jgi:signal transduction histidine kinase/CheY-like chemotaxis protein/ligand-binding sensor domain-containing protein/AraC-like DNA-binding protein
MKAGIKNFTLLFVTKVDVCRGRRLAVSSQIHDENPHTGSKIEQNHPKAMLLQLRFLEMQITATMKPTVLFPFLALLLLATYCPAQVRMEQIGVADGLSQGFVTSIIQDSKGFIWIGTFDGLNRYDGYSVKRFTPKPFDPWALQASFITTLYEDNRGLIWVGTHQGIYVFDPLSERFFNLSLPQYKIPATEVFAVTGDQDGYIYLHIPGDEDKVGLYRLSPPKNFVEQIRKTKSSLEGVMVERVGFASNFHACFILFDCVGDTMVVVRDSLGTTFRHARKDNLLHPFNPSELPNTSSIDHDIWWGKHESWFYRWQGPDGKGANISSYRLLKALKLHDGQIALWTIQRGLFVKKVSANPVQFDLRFPPEIVCETPAFKQTFNPLFQITKSPTNVVLADKSGVIWAGTGGEGVWKINLNQLAFKNLFEGMSVSTLRELADGRVWLRDFSGKNLIVNPLTHQTEPEPWAGLGIKNSIYEVLEDHQGQVWLVESGRHLYPVNKLWKFNKSTRQLTVFPEQIPMLEMVSEKLFEDRDGNIWLAAHKGLVFRCRPGQQHLERFSYARFAANKTNNLRATAIYQDKNGLIWIGTNHGLLRMDGANTDTPQFTLLQHDAQTPGTLSVNWVTSICPDPSQDDFFWIGTRGGGLNHFNIKTQRFSFTTEAPYGLPDNVVYGILPDNRGNLWCSTNRGLCRFDPQRNTFVTYQASDGLLSTEFNTNSYLRTRDGRLWFGGVNGLNVFRPEDIQSGNTPPKVAITGIKVLGVTRLPDSEGALSLPLAENNVLFEYAALDFVNPGANRFRHRLRGIDKDWVYDGTNHSANYAALPPGKYVFELQGATADSPWSEQIVLFELNIRPPWYRTWFAYLCYLLLGVALIGGIIRYRVKWFKLQHEAETNQRESERLKSFETVKNQFFANVAHELRTPLTVILGLANRLKRGTKKEEIEENALGIVEQGNTLLHLTNQILDLAKLESQQFTLKLSNGNFSQHVLHIAESLMPLAQSKGLQLMVENQPSEIWMDFDPGKIRKILNNLISNAIRHSQPGGVIRLATVLEDDGQWVKIAVMDEGEGIAPEDLSNIFERYYQGTQAIGRTGASGLGLTLVRDLVRLMEGKVQVESIQGEGATFSVLLPILNQAPPLESLAPVAAFNHRDNTASVPIKALHLPLLLIVEDNEAVANFLRLCLQEYFRLEIAMDGEMGIEKAIQLIPDLILTDVAMPKKDGYAVCSILKNDLRTSHIPIVMLTAKVEPQDRLEGQRRGANAYLTKPFEEQELLQVLRNLLHLQEQWKNRYEKFSINKDNLSDTGHGPEDLRMEDQFMQNLYTAFENHYTDESFNLERLCRLLGISSSRLDRKLKTLTDRSPMQMLRSFRLQKARLMLQDGSGLSVKDVCFRTGFKSPAHFSRAFSEEFGVPPSGVS